MNIIEILDQYDGVPLLHIRQDDAGQKYFCHCIDFPHFAPVVFLVIPVTEADLDAVKSNQSDLRSILDRRPALILKWDEEEVFEDCIETIPDNCLPKPGVTLRPC